jgi:hypothetical protein
MTKGEDMNVIVEPPEEEIGELVPHESEPTTLFHTSDPVIALQRMSRIATKLVEVVDDRKLYTTISGKKYLFVSAWTTLGGMLGVFPIVIWTRPNESGDGILARVEARTRAGEVIGAAEAECSRAEPRWEKSAPYAIRSMASTRAISRALRGPLEQVVVLAGYEATAAEEMPVDQDERPKPSSPVEGAEASPEQLEEIKTLVRTLARLEPDTDWPARCREISGVPANKLVRGGANILIDKLRGELARLHEEGPQW